MAFVSVNPATGETLATYTPHTPEQLCTAVHHVAEAFPEYAALPMTDRAERLRRLARILTRRGPELAALATLEMGKPIVQARAEVTRCAHALDVLATEGPTWLAEEARPSEARRSSVRFDPLGAILGIMPWNFPYWQTIRFAAPALLAGNVVLVKPAPSTVGCAFALQAAFREAGFVHGQYQTVLAEVRDLEVLVESDAVAGVALTGSVRAGRSIAQLAGACIKPVVLELGGSDAFVVLDDAEVAAAAAAAVEARCFNNGQSCIAAKRFIATPRVYDAFVDAFATGMNRLRIGDPLSELTDLGPLARFDLRDELLTLLDGPDYYPRKVYPVRRRALPDRGAYFQPAIVEYEADRLGALWHQEVFGPVAVIVRASSVDHAFTLAARSRYGLGCSIWTADPDACHDAVARLPVGNVFFNAPVKSNVRLPFGGVRESGFGRELGREGVRQFTNIKTVWVA